MVTGYILFIFFIPLLSFFLQFLLPKRIDKLKSYISCIILFLSTCLSIYTLVSIYKAASLPLLEKISFSVQTSLLSSLEYSWINLPNLKINFGVFADSVSVIMLTVVSLISFLVHIFSLEYMDGDKRYSRYYAYLGIFTFSMNGIVLSNNLFFTFIFWELVGLSSFLLIGFWYEKVSAGNAAKKAFLVNRVGDIGMFLGIMLIFFTCGTFNYKDIAIAAVELGPNFTLSLAGILIFMGAVGKSAQFPLHIWLPDAMEGPTPVSALIHAATMVAAGVYMTLRIFPFLTVETLHIIAIIGAITALVASLIATSQFDIKKILAYSTVSQLGFMVCAIGVGAYFAAFFHLITHAMFKACLFLCSGSVIHSFHHSLDHIEDHSKDAQDIRNMGGVATKMPFTFITMLVATLSLSGAPLFSGFLSKDSIIAGTLGYYHTFNGFSILIPIFIIFSAGLTSFYMFRLIFCVFLGKPKYKELHSHLKESPLLMLSPLILLSVLSLGNIFSYPNINPVDYHGWFYSLIIIPQDTIGYNMTIISEHIHHAHGAAMGWSIFMALFGFVIAFIKYYLKIDILNLSKLKVTIATRELFLNKFYIDELYQNIIVNPYLRFSRRASILDWNIYDQLIIDSVGWITIRVSKLSNLLDYNLIDQFVVDGFARLTNKSGKELQSTQNGIFQSYLIAGFIGIIILLIIIQQLG